jgi:coenzyme Q-binding protein COQ10
MEIVGDCGVVSVAFGKLRYSPEQMFAVVAAVDLYEDFVPWCQRSRIIRRHDDCSFDAELEIGFKFLVESYVSHVEMEKPKYIKVRVV